MDEDEDKDKGCLCDCTDCIFNCNPPHLKFMPKCPGHAHHHCSFANDCNSIYIPPCGGCRTDPRPYPDLFCDTCPPHKPQMCHKKYPEFGVGLTDLRSAIDKKHNPNTLGRAEPKRIPPFGPPKIPIDCHHPVMPPNPWQRPCSHPKPGCPGCTPYDTPYEEEPQIDPKEIRETILSIPRPDVCEKLILKIEYSAFSDFSDSVELIDTSKETAKLINEDIISVCCAGFSIDRPAPIFTSGISCNIDKIGVKIVAKTEISQLMYRYQWFKLDGTGLGWVIY